MSTSGTLFAIGLVLLWFGFIATGSRSRGRMTRNGWSPRFSDWFDYLCSAVALVGIALIAASGVAWLIE